jgi:signal transduction histidine kinase/ActR/RegA family two-component response regulator
MRPSLADPKVALQTLTRFAESLLRANSLSDLVWEIAQNVGELLGFEDCVIYLKEPDGLVQVAAFGIKNPQQREIFNRIVLPIGKGIVGTVAQGRRPERIADTLQDPRYVHDTYSGRSELAVPILYGDSVLGVLDSESKDPNAYTAEDEAMFVAIATLMAPRIASALAERDHADAVKALEKQEREQKDREQQLREERLEALGKLAGGIAHDFNNLLTAILGNIGMARMDLPAGETTSILADAEEACLRARGLTKQLLTFAHGGEPVRQIGDITKLARDSILFALHGTKTQARFQIAPDVSSVSFDEGQMAHVFHSLAINAVQASPEGGSLRIEIKNRPDLMPGSVELRVHDDGPGIPEHLRSRIFDPFFTTRSGGTGLGLATSFWVLKRHGGNLMLDPTVTKGACFVLTLPAVERKASPAAQAPAQVSLKGRRLLLVDDESGVRKLFTLMAPRLLCSIDAVATSDDAIAAWRKARADGKPYDAAVLDLTMPGDRDGHATLQLLRQEDPSIRAIVTSGYHDDPVLARHKEFGFAARLEKPFSIGAFEAALRQALEAG